MLPPQTQPRPAAKRVEIEAIRSDCFADDIELPVESINWTAADARSYFETGGAGRPVSAVVAAAAAAEQPPFLPQPPAQPPQAATAAHSPFAAALEAAEKAEADEIAAARRSANADATIAASAAHPLTGDAGEYDDLLTAIGDAQFVLLGESTHGTTEFYEQVPKGLWHWLWRWLCIAQWVAAMIAYCRPFDVHPTHSVSVRRSRGV